MKQLLSFLAFLPWIGSANSSIAQTDQQRNKVVFEKLQQYINNKSTDSLYSLLNDNFQKQFSRQMIEGVLVSNVYNMGGITDANEISHRNGVSAYKVSYANGAQKMMLGADSSFKIYTLVFRPWQDEVKIPSKDHRSATDNKLTTLLDRQVDTIARQYIDKINAVGLSIGILKDGKMMIYNYGETTKGNGKLPGSNTMFEIGSVTKTFTATLLAWYAQQGKVSLTDPITKYLPDSVTSNKELSGITLQMLSNHTSGLPRVPFNLSTGDKDADPYAAYDDAKLFYFLKNCKPLSIPGTKYDYSNTAVGLLGVILERVSGVSYDKMVKDVIAKPLAMSHTAQHLTAGERKTLTAVYDEKGGEVIPWNFQSIAGAGCLRSTVSDLLNYAAANMTDNNSTLYKAMRLTHEITVEKGSKVGLGWHFSGKGSPWLWHNGGTGGSSSFVAFNPDKKVAVVILSNAATSVDDIAKEIMDIAK